MIIDYRDYEEEKCRTGGAYGFWTEYDRIESGDFEISYGTTSEFEYCPVCGSFYQETCSCCGYPEEENYETISVDDMQKVIEEFIEE